MGKMKRPFPGFSIMFSIGKYAGWRFVYKKGIIRIVLGWISLVVSRSDLDALLCNWIVEKNGKVKGELNV